MHRTRSARSNSFQTLNVQAAGTTHLPASSARVVPTRVVVVWARAGLAPAQGLRQPDHAFRPPLPVAVVSACALLLEPAKLKLKLKHPALSTSSCLIQRRRRRPRPDARQTRDTCGQERRAAK